MAAIDWNNELGVDFSCLEDLDPSLTLVDGNLALGQSSGRRLITPRGGLFYDRNFGSCVRRFLKAGVTTPTRIGRMCEQEVLKDERVKAVAAEVSWSDQDETLEIGLRITPVAGRTFALTINVDELDVELLYSDVVV